MNNLYKIIAFATISFLCAYGASSLRSDYVDKFAENVLALLTTLFAINVASSTLIAGKLRDIQNLTGHEFPSTKKSLKNCFFEQIAFIGVVLLFSILRDSAEIQLYIGVERTKIICDVVIFFSFFYFIDAVRDIGVALFELLNFGDRDNKP